MQLLERAASPLLALLAAILVVVAGVFAFTSHTIAMPLVVLVTLLLLADAALFALVAWSSTQPGPRWRPFTLVLIGLNIVGTAIDQIGIADIAFIVLLAVAAAASFVHAPRR